MNGRRSPLTYVVLLASATAISGFLFGFDTAAINGVLLLLRRQFGLSDLQTEVAASALLMGCLPGAASASLIGDRCGRKKSLVICGILFAVSSLAAAEASTLALFTIARFLGGLAIGLGSVLTPIYIAEISPPENRGTLVSMNQLAIVIGILVAYLSNWQLSRLGDESWRWMLAVGAIPSLAFLAALIVIPESPRWLIMRCRPVEAERILARIVGKQEAEAQTQAIIKATSDEIDSWNGLFSRGMRKRLGIGIALALFQQFTGINAVLYYGSIIIREHFPTQLATMALATNVIIGLVNLIFTIVAMIYLDRWGRRAILMVASGGMGLALTVLVIGLNLPGTPVVWVLASILAYVAFFALGMGPVPWLIISEIFPTRVRGRAASVATAALWIGTLVVTFTFLTLVGRLKLSGTFTIYGAISFMCAFYVRKMVPETKARTLERIQELWDH